MQGHVEKSVVQHIIGYTVQETDIHSLIAQVEAEKAHSVHIKTNREVFTLQHFNQCYIPLGKASAGP